MMLLGGLLLTTPNTVLALCRAAPAREFWVRFVGGALFNVGWIYVAAAREHVVPFYRWTIWARMLVCSTLALFVYLHIAETSLLIFAAVDGIGTSITAVLYWHERGEAARWTPRFASG
jgi:hypothetical protein